VALGDASVGDTYEGILPFCAVDIPQPLLGYAADILQQRSVL
jgi:hypothetical protein